MVRLSLPAAVAILPSEKDRSIIRGCKVTTFFWNMQINLTFFNKKVLFCYKNCDKSAKVRFKSFKEESDLTEGCSSTSCCCTASAWVSSR